RHRPALNGALEEREPSEDRPRPAQRMLRPAREIEAVALVHDQAVLELELREDDVDDLALAAKEVARGPLDRAAARRDLRDRVGNRELPRAAEESSPHSADLRSLELEDRVAEAGGRRVEARHRLRVTPGQGAVEALEDLSRFTDGHAGSISPAGA